MVATAPIQPLAWEPPHAEGAAQEMAKRQKKNLKQFKLIYNQPNTKMDIDKQISLKQISLKTPNNMLKQSI